MKRIPIRERADWVEKAKEYGFRFHTIAGERYWDESAYYQFSLQQIEDDIEAPTAEIHRMCLEVVAKVLQDEGLLQRFCIPPEHWELVRNSWKNGDPSLYSRLDLAYDGKGPAKLFENNADTPTSVYETGFWQWLWLEDNVDSGRLPQRTDQYNSLQDKLVNRFKELQHLTPERILHFASCQGSNEDRGTVQYLDDCAQAAGISTQFVPIEKIGRDSEGNFSDLDDHAITWMFKLYPWELMFREEFGAQLGSNNIRWLEPPWKSILSNKALLPLLWRMFPDHPNLLPAFFEDELASSNHSGALVKKPIFSREGANITLLDGNSTVLESDGPYGEEGYIYQACHLLPKFDSSYTVVGSWLVDDQPAGLSIREDASLITQDSSRYLPHVILS